MTMNDNPRSQHDAKESHTQATTAAKATLVNAVYPGWTVSGVGEWGRAKVILVPRSAIAAAIEREIAQGINPLTGQEIEPEGSQGGLWKTVAVWARLYGPVVANLEAGAAKDNRVGIRCAGDS